MNQRQFGLDQVRPQRLRAEDFRDESEGVLSFRERGKAGLVDAYALRPAKSQLIRLLSTNPETHACPKIDRQRGYPTTSL